MSLFKADKISGVSVPDTGPKLELEPNGSFNFDNNTLRVNVNSRKVEINGATDPNYKISVSTATSTNLILPQWNDLTRPSNPEAGLIGYNTTIKATELYTGTAWIVWGGGPVADPTQYGLNPSNPAPSVALIASTTNGIYYVKHNSETHAFYVDFTTAGGPWILVNKMPSNSTANSNYGYDASMWTAASGGTTSAPTGLLEDEYYLSSAFYTYSTTVTRLSMFQPTRWNGILHSFNTVRGLCNGSFNSVSASQGSTGSLAANTTAAPGNYKPLGLSDAVVASGNKATSANTWHRYGYMPNSNDRWGHDIRIGWCADNDSSDSGDSVIGFGFKAYSNAPSSNGGVSGGFGCGWSYYSTWTSGSGAFAGRMQGWIWVKA
jgi:hypothetical protein